MRVIKTILITLGILFACALAVGVGMIAVFLTPFAFIILLGILVYFIVQEDKKHKANQPKDGE